MDLLAISSYVYLFAGDLLPTKPQAGLRPSFEDSAGRFVEQKDLEALCLTAELFDLKHQGLILIEGNGTITYIKKSGSNEMPKPPSTLAFRILETLRADSVKVPDFVKAFTKNKGIAEHIYEDLLRLELLKKSEAKKFLVIRSGDSSYDHLKIEALQGKVPQIQAKVENFKLDPTFVAVLAQIRSAL